MSACGVSSTDPAGFLVPRARFLRLREFRFEFLMHRKKKENIPQQFGTFPCGPSRQRDAAFFARALRMSAEVCAVALPGINRSSNVKGNGYLGEPARNAGCHSRRRTAL